MTVERIVVRSVQSAAATGHGGNRRMQQVDELLSRAGVPIERWTDTFAGDDFRSNLRRVVRGVLPFSRWIPMGSVTRLLHPRALRNAGALAELLADFDVGPGTAVVLDSYLRAYQPMLPRLRARGARVVILPQNLDSLTPGATDPLGSRRSPSWLADEVSILREADLVCCISREEQWLLAAVGVPSLYVPYFPPADVRGGLHRIRVARRDSAKTKVVILGTAKNPPTLAGLRTMVEHAQAIVDASGGCEVQLMGYGTEVLATSGLPRNFRVLGGVSDDDLRDALISARVALCYQHGTGGALTRISDLLCAGVPVIANPIAARSYYGLPGLTVVENIRQMVEALHGEQIDDFEPPDEPAELEAEFLRVFCKL